MESTVSSGPQEAHGIDVPAVAVELRLACQKIARRVRFESAGAEAAPHQLAVLAHLGQRPSTPSDLAELEKVSPPSMTRTVAGLVDRGFIARTANPHDGRQVILSLTDEGAAVLARTRARRDAWMSTRLSGLPDEDIAALARAAAILTTVADS